MSRRDPGAAPDRKQTFTGRYIYVGHPSIEQVDLLDVAMAMPHILRYDGATINDGGWSDANHLRLATKIAHRLILAPEAKMLGLDARSVVDTALHDAHEYAIGDITSPAKAGMDGVTPGAANGITSIKTWWDVAIYGALQLPWSPPHISGDNRETFVKMCDTISYRIESKLFTRNGWEPFEDIAQFEDLFEELVEWPSYSRVAQAHLWLYDVRDAIIGTEIPSAHYAVEIIGDTLQRV